MEEELNKTENDELFKYLFDWGVQNKFGLIFSADSDIKIYTIIKINFNTKEIYFS